MHRRINCRRNIRKIQTQDASLSLPSNIAVNKLYLSQLLDVDQKGILITSVEKESEIENKILLKLKHSNKFSFLQSSYNKSKFPNFPRDATINVNEILLKKSSTIDEDVYEGDWDIIHIMTEEESDCDYLFKKAIEDKYTVILAIRLEIFDINNASQQLTLYSHGDDGPLLHRAVAEKDMKIIKTLIDYKLDINVINDAGWTPLHVAVHLNKFDAVDLLISNGADVNVRNNKGQVPLHLAAKRNNLKILENLLKSQAKLDEKDELEQTPLHYAVDAGNLDAVDILLKKGANYQLTDKFGSTAFHLAIKQNSDIIEAFLNVNADILNCHGQTPLFYVIEASFFTQPKAHYKQSCLKLNNTFLKKGANIIFQDSELYSPLYYAVIDNKIESINNLLKKCPNVVNISITPGRNLLHSACWSRANKCIKTLLNFNIDINAVDVNKTALHVAVETKNYDAVELILKMNPIINMSDNHDKTPLYWAVESNCLPIIKLLLKKKADVNLEDDFEQTALHVALEKIDTKKNFLIKLLLENKADVNLKDASGKTALHFASENPTNTINIVKSVVNSTSDINAKDIFKWSALHCAAVSHNVSTLKYLLEENTDINAKEFRGKTPLHLTINSTNEYISCIQCIKALLDHKADINAVDDNLRSPLHLACWEKNVEVVKYLIENGADSNMRDKDGRTVFHYVCMYKLQNLSSMLVDNMKKRVEDVLNVLVKENISVNCADRFGETPLNFGAHISWFFIKNKLLLNIGADINILGREVYSTFTNYIEQEYHFMKLSITDSAPLTEHIVKMKVMKLWVREKLLDIIYKMDNEEFLEWLQSYERDCSREVDLMKSTNLSENNITYYDFLKKSPHDVVNYTRNHNVVNAIQSNEPMFPIYDNFLKNHLRNSQRRSYLYGQIEELWKLYIFKKLPTLCMYEILRYLDHSDLTTFLEAMKPNGFSKRKH